MASKSKNVCCFKSCKNSRKNSSNIHFYSFPTLFYKMKQREEWINAVIKENNYEMSWTPKKHHLICSSHFVGNSKSDNQFSPSYIPTLKLLNSTANLSENILVQRFDSFMNTFNGKEKNRSIEENNFSIEVSEVSYVNELNINDAQVMETENTPLLVNQGCQAEIFLSVKDYSKSFTCVRYC